MERRRKKDYIDSVGRGRIEGEAGMYVEWERKDMRGGKNVGGRRIWVFKGQAER